MSHEMIPSRYIHKCDKCGIIKETESRATPTHWFNVQIFMHTGGDMPFAEYDLCARCKERLFTWFRTKVPNMSEVDPQTI